MNKHIQAHYKSYLKHAAIWLALVLLAGWVFAVSLELVLSMLCIVLIIMAIWKVDELIPGIQRKYKQELILGFLIGIGCMLLATVLVAIIYFHPKGYGGLLLFAILVPLIMFIVEFIYAIGKANSPDMLSDSTIMS